MAAVLAQNLRELDPEWRKSWNALDIELRDWLKAAGLVGPNIWTGLPFHEDSRMEDLWNMVQSFEWPWSAEDSVVRLGRPAALEERPPDTKSGSAG